MRPVVVGCSAEGPPNADAQATWLRPGPVAELLLVVWGCKRRPAARSWAVWVLKAVAWTGHEVGGRRGRRRATAQQSPSLCFCSRKCAVVNLGTVDARTKLLCSLKLLQSGRILLAGLAQLVVGMGKKAHGFRASRAVTAAGIAVVVRVQGALEEAVCIRTSIQGAAAGLVVGAGDGHVTALPWITANPIGWVPKGACSEIVRLAIVAWLHL